MMGRVVPSYSQRSVPALPVIRIKIAIKGAVLLDMKQAVINYDCLDL